MKKIHGLTISESLRPCQRCGLTRRWVGHTEMCVPCYRDTRHSKLVEIEATALRPVDKEDELPLDFLIPEKPARRKRAPDRGARWLFMYSQV